MTPTPASRVLLVQDPRRAAGPHAERLRRYRLARMRLIDRRLAVPARHPHLGRIYD
jgi:hypothetical protein